MNYIDKRNEVDALQQYIHAAGELEAGIKKKIHYKFRLDWNYYSNSMEGNTLTMEETRSVMVGNLTVGGKPIKDVLEIKGHDEIISEILRIGRGETRLSETRIREIHSAIMYEEDDSKRDKIGKWKTEPNYLLHYKGERFDFTAPDEVPVQLHDLLNRTNAAIDAIQQKKKDAPHPVDIALQFHLEYVKIHPFYDGNGRTARILTNLLLIAFGYPPFWIKTTEREMYNRYLGDIQGYGGAPDLFMTFAAGLIMRSQQIIRSAIAGEDIQEPADLDKKLALLQKELEAVDEEDGIKEQFSLTLFSTILDSWFRDLVLAFIPEVQKFNRFFRKVSHTISFRNSGGLVIPFTDENAEVIFDQLRTQFHVNRGHFQPGGEQIYLNTAYEKLVKGGLDTFDLDYRLEIRFEQIRYELYMDQFEAGNQLNRVRQLEHLIHKPLKAPEITGIVRRFTNALYDQLDVKTRAIRSGKGTNGAFDGK